MSESVWIRVDMNVKYKLAIYLTLAFLTRIFSRE